MDCTWEDRRPAAQRRLILRLDVRIAGDLFVRPARILEALGPFRLIMTEPITDGLVLCADGLRDGEGLTS
jgi:hypothetical protein